MSAHNTYPLLPFSQLVYDSTRWLPDVYTIFNIQLRVRGVSYVQAHDILRNVLSNHPVFRMRLDRKGRQYEEYTSDVLKGPFHNIEMYGNEENLCVNVGMNRILGDDYSLKILVEDIVREYSGLILEPDDYWGYIARYEQRKIEQHCAASREWLIKKFADERVPVRPTIDRWCVWTIIPPKVGIHTNDYTDLHRKLLKFAETKHLSTDGLFSLCTALAIAEYCGTDESALTWAYQGRETIEEQRIFGSLHRDVPFKIKVNGRMDEWRKKELIKEARNQIRFGIAHSDYPYTLTAPYNKRWNYAVNVLRAPDITEILSPIPLPIEIISIPKQKYAYALLDIEILERAESLQLRYRYSATHYKPESIYRFADLVRKYVEWLVTD